MTLSVFELIAAACEFKDKKMRQIVELDKQSKKRKKCFQPDRQTSQS